MKLVVERTGKLGGSVTAPPSKSHTHRAIVIASLADGVSKIENPLRSADCQATIDACRKFGAEIAAGDPLEVKGVAGRPRNPGTVIDAGNSGTTIRFMTAISALCDGKTSLTGDSSVRTRPIDPLLRSLIDLGASKAQSINGNGCPPVTVAGRMKGGRTAIDGSSSQFVSALLVSCPLAACDTAIDARDLISRPYVRMTLEHLERAGAMVRHRELREFRIEGNQSYEPVSYAVPGDYSSAAFLMAAAHITESQIEIKGLDGNDSQGDRAIMDIIGQMRSGNRRVMDLQDTPDLLPICAVLGCNSDGTTVLTNVSHARQKESDRIFALCAELRKMGAHIEERPDGLTVRGSGLKGAELDGHGDHRVVMALAVAALNAEGPSTVNDADTISNSYPGFVEDLAHLGANIKVVGE
jgi:3-phosphoshikimate 1-carboxyvinyltransferase